MKTFTKKQLLVGKASSKGTTRQAMCGVLIEGNKTIATNGHMLIVNEDKTVGEAWPLSGINWKEHEAIVPSDKAEPFILSNEAVKKALKSFPKVKRGDTSNRSRLAIGLTDTGITIQNADNDKIEAQPVDGKFPNYEQVMPETTDYLKVALDAKLLKTICEVMEKSGRGCIVLKIDKNTKEGQAIVIENKDQAKEKITAILMPVRL